MCTKGISIIVLVICFLGPELGFPGGRANTPDKPHNLRAFTRFDGATGVVELNWHDGSDNELGFEILRSDNSKEFRLVGMVGANTMRYDDKVGKYVTGGFAYRVRAFNEAGKSEESNTVAIWF